MLYSIKYEGRTIDTRKTSFNNAAATYYSGHNILELLVFVQRVSTGLIYCK